MKKNVFYNLRKISDSELVVYHHLGTWGSFDL